jgi:transposase
VLLHGAVAQCCLLGFLGAAPGQSVSNVDEIIGDHVMTAHLFGVSLPTAYQAHAAFEAAGIAGLLPRRRGPRQGHKLTPEVQAHIERRRRERPDWRTSDLLADLERTFGLTVHRRSLERMLRSKKKLSSR